MHGQLDAAAHPFQVAHPYAWTMSGNSCCVHQGCMHACVHACYTFVTQHFYSKLLMWSWPG
jgi:hypothetical protein